MSNIKSMLYAAWNLIKSAADVNHIHIECDCYFEESIKECEQIYGSAEVDPLEYINLSLLFPIPVQLDQFWAF